MESCADKRVYERYECNTQAYLYRHDDRDSSYSAGIYNYSMGGNYMISDEKMGIGQQVYIKIKNHDPSQKGPEKQENYTGYVRWSNELGTSYPGGQYGYGIEYDDPAKLLTTND